MRAVQLRPALSELGVSSSVSVRGVLPTLFPSLLDASQLRSELGASCTVSCQCTSGLLRSWHAGSLGGQHFPTRLCSIFTLKRSRI